MLPDDIEPDEREPEDMPPLLAPVDPVVGIDAEPPLALPVLPVVPLDGEAAPPPVADPIDEPVPPPDWASAMTGIIASDTARAILRILFS